MMCVWGSRGCEWCDAVAHVEIHGIIKCARCGETYELDDVRVPLHVCGDDGDEEGMDGAV